MHLNRAVLNTWGILRCGEKIRILWFEWQEQYPTIDPVLDMSEVIDVFTSKDMENTPPESRMNFTSGVFSSKTLVSIK